MIAAPTFDSFTRAGATAVAVVSGVDPLNTCEIYGMRVMQPAPSIVLYGSRVGDGAVNLAGLPTFLIMEITIAEQIVFFAVATDGLNYSPPSAESWPRTIKVVDLTLTGLTRTPDRTSITFTVGGLSSATATAIIAIIQGGIIKLQSFTGNGEHTVTGLSPYGLPVNLVVLEYSPDGTLIPSGAAEEIGAVTIEAGSPRNERIIDHVTLTLASITTANGYHQTIKQVVRKKSAGLTKFVSWPAIDLLIGEEIKTETTTQGYMENALSLSVAGWTDDHVNPDQALSYLAADIEKALRVDHQRGGLAVSTYVHEVSRDFNDPDQSPSGMIDLRVDISYRHKGDNPYQ